MSEFKGKSFGSFGSNLDYLSQFSDEVSIMEQYHDIEPREYIHTGCYKLNAQISGSAMKGAASNKVYLFAGDPKTGKSYVLYNIMRNCIAMGYTPYMFETENSPDKQRMINQNVDISKVLFEQPETVDDIIIPLTRMTKQMLADKKKGIKLPKVAIFIDSLTSLNSVKQYTDAEEGVAKQDMGTVAKDLKRLFNMLTVRLGKLQIPVFCTAHVYEKDMGHFRKRVPTGGNAAMFMASCICLFSKKEDKDKDTKERLGIYVTSEVVESRFSKPQNIDLYISRDKGMNPYYGLDEISSWEINGLDKGKLIQLTDFADELVKKKIVTQESIVGYTFTKAEISKILSKAKAENIEAHIEAHIEKGILVEKEDSRVYYEFTDEILKRFVDGVYYLFENEVVGIVNKASSQYIVKHLGRGFTTKKEIYNKQVFSKEMLTKLDEHVIRPMFEYSQDVVDTDDTDIEDIDTYAEEDTDLDTEE